MDWNNPRVASILSAAAKCFARGGFSATTLAEIGKELGLRKSIVHYYFASKSALIHEVQSYTYHRYLERAREAVHAGSGENPVQRSMTALKSLWESLQANPTSLWLNIEVWSAARRDDELKRRASALQKDARRLIAEELKEALGRDPARLEAVSALILGVLNGLSVGEYLEGDQGESRRAYDYFLHLLAADMKSGGGAAAHAHGTGSHAG